MMKINKRKLKNSQTARKRVRVGRSLYYYRIRCITNFRIWIRDNVIVRHKGRLIDTFLY